jgi:hypothetical protein
VALVSMIASWVSQTRPALVMDGPAVNPGAASVGPSAVAAAALAEHTSAKHSTPSATTT